MREKREERGERREERVVGRLRSIYGDRIDQNLIDRILGLVDEFHVGNERPEEKWNQEDIILITYGDSILDEGEVPLKTLHNFLDKHLKEVISILHILPFYPYSSDDGFSVIDYMQVNHDLGSWKDIEDLSKDYDLMADLVINHISKESLWFRNFIKGNGQGGDYFIDMDPATDLRQVIRPRRLPLLTAFDTENGVKHVWTTFSEDQVDLDFRNPVVCYEMLRVLLFYISKGARIIRLDAIAFLWKVVGTECLHLPETHEMVRLMRDMAEMVDPRVIILTETNVPNEENLSYLGNGDEAHMIYQFSLPPLLLHALYSGNSSYLNNWASSIPDPPRGCTYFNFTASHDGIGVRPLEGLLPETEFMELLEAMRNNGAHISTRRNADGSDTPYEMNITYFDALKSAKNGQGGQQVRRFLCSQAIMMSMKGIPAFYIHSLTATTNYHEGVKASGRARTINRRKWNLDELTLSPWDENPQATVFNELSDLIRIRKKQAAFHPDAGQEVMDPGNDFFAIKRISPGQNIVVIANISHQNKTINSNNLEIISNNYIDLISGMQYHANQEISIYPYQTLWISST